jgi:hypothetical protein
MNCAFSWHITKLKQSVFAPFDIYELISWCNKLVSLLLSALTNTLAFYVTELIMAVKSFKIQASGVNVIKPLSSVLMMDQNKLERLYPTSPF